MKGICLRTTRRNTVPRLKAHGDSGDSDKEESTLNSPLNLHIQCCNRPISQCLSGLCCHSEVTATRIQLVSLRPWQLFDEIIFLIPDP